MKCLVLGRCQAKVVKLILPFSRLAGSELSFALSAIVGTPAQLQS